MTLPLARTSSEAHVYMELRPCPACGEHRFGPMSAVVVVDGELASRYAGACPQCGTAREFVFRLPPEAIFPDGDEPVFGDERPSELLDAGEWLWLADQLTQGLPAEPTESMSVPERRQARQQLLLAAAATAEVRKFVPAGADMVPASAIWSERGREVYGRERGRFHRLRLEAVGRTYREIARRFDDQAGPGREPDSPEVLA